MRIYIAGPMTGLPDYNYPAFNEAEVRLQALGHEPQNPARNPEPPCGTWQGYMRMAIRQLALCDAIVLLPGWKTSRGACIEKRLAEDLGLKVLHASEVLA